MNDILNIAKLIRCPSRKFWDSEGHVIPRKKWNKLLKAIEPLIDVDRSLTLAAAHIKAQFPLAYADTFAVALGRQENARVVTGDPEFEAVESLVAIEWLPR